MTKKNSPDPDKTSQPVHDDGRPVTSADNVKRNFPKMTDSWLGDDLVNQSGNGAGTELTDRRPPGIYQVDGARYKDPHEFQAHLLAGDRQPRSGQDAHLSNYYARTQRLTDRAGDGWQARDTEDGLENAARRGGWARHDEKADRHQSALGSIRDEFDRSRVAQLFSSTATPRPKDDDAEFQHGEETH